MKRTFRVTFAGVERHYRSVTVEATSERAAIQLARQLARDLIEPEGNEDLGDWCDGSGVEPSSVRLSSIEEVRHA